MLLKLGIVFIAIFMSSNDHTCHGTDIPHYGDGYFYTAGIGWHKFHNVAKSWNAARKICMMEGAHLAVLNSPNEEQLLHGVLSRYYHTTMYATHRDSAWLGYHNLFDPTEWVTIHGHAISSKWFDPWHKSATCWGPQPDNPHIAHCGALIRPCGMMDDAVCSSRYAFFCEKPEHWRSDGNSTEAASAQPDA